MNMKQGADGVDTTTEIVSLTERLSYMSLLRVGFVATALAVVISAARSHVIGLTDVLVMSGGYLVVAALSEGWRRRRRARGLVAIGVMLLVDGLYLAWLIYATGGVASPLRLLLYVDLVAVSLLASYRTGLKIALWHSLLLFVAFYAQLSGLLIPLEPITGDANQAAAEFNAASVFDVAAFWVTAIVTAFFSYVNERELRRRQDDLGALAAMSKELKDLSDAGSTADLFLGQALKTFSFSRGLVVRVHDDGTEVLATDGDVRVRGRAVLVDQLLQTAWKDGDLRIRRITLSEEPAVEDVLPEARSVIVVPLAAEGLPVGALILEVPRGTVMDSRTMSMLEQFAVHAALALRNTWLLEEVQTLAETDPLTGIANRRVFETTLDREISRAARTGELVSLLMFDIDHFKALNDKHGHDAGDEVLKAVAKVLASCSRNFDTVARYGGEEFGIVLADCTLSEAFDTADRLRDMVSGLQTVEPITVSAGVASYPTHAGDRDDLISVTDKALYESKSLGRNRVRMAVRPAAMAGLQTEGEDHEATLGFAVPPMYAPPPNL
ncbi:MAG: diguanylate cyclase [Actinomycetota bacterium]